MNILNNLEKKVFLFTILLVIAMFVTVALYVYAGKQKHLPTRELGAVSINKTLSVGQKIYQKTSVVTLDHDDNMQVSENISQIIFYTNPGNNIDIYIPTVSSLKNMKNFKIGTSFTIYLINDSSNNVTLESLDVDGTMTFLNESEKPRPKGMTKLVIYRVSETNFQTIIG